MSPDSAEGTGTGGTDSPEQKGRPNHQTLLRSVEHVKLTNNAINKNYNNYYKDFTSNSNFLKAFT